MSHTWKYEDDILVYYLYRYGEDRAISVESVVKFLGFNDDGSVKMRIKNFQACDGNGGLENYAQLTKQVHDDFFNIESENALLDAQITAKVYLSIMADDKNT